MLRNIYIPNISLIVFFCFLYGCSHQVPTEKNTPEYLYQKLNKNPDDTAARYARAQYFIEQKKLDSALSDLQHLTKIDSSNAHYFVTLGDVYLYLNRTRYTKQAYEKAISLNPQYEDARMKLAELYLYVEMRKEAIEQLNAVLRINVRNPKAYYMKGIVYKEGGDTTMALSSFLTATEQDPEYVLAFEQMGLIYAAKHDKRAVDFYKTALKINAQSPTVLYNLGLFYQNQGENEKAIETYQELLKTNPGTASAAYNIGYIKSEIEKKPSEAIEWFKKAAEINPQYAEALYMIGYSLENMGKREEAIAAYKKCLKTVPSYMLARNSLSRLGVSAD